MVMDDRTSRTKPRAGLSIALAALALAPAACSTFNGYAGTTALSFMRRARESDDPNNRYDAFRHLASPNCYENAEQKADAVRLMIAALEGGKEPVATRALLCQTMGVLGRPEARETLLRYADDPDALIRAEALRALGKVGQPDDSTRLVRAMLADADDPCKIAAIEALGDLKPDDPRILNSLADGMENPSPAIRLACLHSLRAITGTDLGREAPPGANSPSPAPRPPRRPRPRPAPHSPAARPTPPRSPHRRSEPAPAWPPSWPSRVAGAGSCVREWPPCEPRPRGPCRLAGRGVMDTHTLELLDFGRIRELVASYAACSLGKDAARRMAPHVEPGPIRHAQALTTEMADALSAGLSPPLGGLHDIRANVRRAQVGAALTAEDLAEVVEVLGAVANLDRWLGRVGDEFPRLGALKAGVGEFSGVAVAIQGCLDSRGKVLDTASRKLSNIRQEIGQVEGRIQDTLRSLLRSPAHQAHPALSQLHDGRPSLCPADRQGASRRDPGLGPPHQLQQRDGLRRAAGDRRAVGAALVPACARGEGDPPHPALARAPRSARSPIRC